MSFRNLILFFFILFIVSEYANAQQTEVKKDSTKIYKDIESFSKKRKFTGFMYKMFFKPIEKASKKKSAKSKQYRKLIKRSYKAFEGKIIRHINIETLDPFGYSVADTSLSPHNFFLKAGNVAHIKSQQIAIQNLLLFRKNQPFDSLLVKESERLIRIKKYVHEVSFVVTATSENSDSVDILIRESDKWSIIPKVAASNPGISVNLTDKNIAGLGHESSNSLALDNSKNEYAYNINYLIPNIKNSYVSSTLNISKDLYDKSVRSFAIDRPFYSPFARWAAGAGFKQVLMDSVYFGDTLLVKHRYRYNVHDYWAGSSIQLFKGNTENRRTTSFISTLRYLRIRYLEKPEELSDSYHKICNEDFYLAAIGLSKRRYVQDKFIFKFGVTEHVPVGKVYSLTTGYQVKEHTERLYFGMRFSVGDYHEWGYLSSTFEYGTFYHSGRSEQGIFTADANYFTGLIEIGRFKFRQFIKPQFTLGIDRFPNDSITLNHFFDQDKLNSSSLSGSTRLSLTLQTQSYLPWNLAGFRFGPYIVISLGMLGNELIGLKDSKLYSQIGIGVLIKNENMVFSTFQISVAFYPSIPGIGNDIFKLNSFKTTDFGFRDFEIGKPAPVQFY